MTEEMDKCPRTRAALEDFDRVLNGPPGCQPPTWEGDFEDLVEWATKFVIQERKKKNAEHSRVSSTTDQEEPDRDHHQEEDSQEIIQPSMLSGYGDGVPDWVLDYFRNAQRYHPRLENIVRSIRDVKLAMFEDDIAELARFVDDTLRPGCPQEVPHDEELHILDRELSKMENFLEDLRMDKKDISTWQRPPHTVVCRSCVSQFLTSFKRYRHFCALPELEEVDGSAEYAKEVSELDIEEGSEEEAECMEYLQRLWKEVKEEDIEQYRAFYQFADDLGDNAREYLLLNEANYFLSEERRLKAAAASASQDRQMTTISPSEDGPVATVTPYKTDTASQIDIQATTIPPSTEDSQTNVPISNRETTLQVDRAMTTSLVLAEDGQATVHPPPQKRDTGADQIIIKEAERSAGHKLPGLRWWFKSLSQRFRH